MKTVMRTLLAAVATLALGGAAAAQQAQTMRLMTGPQGGVWVPLGGQLKDMWEKAIPGLSVTSMPGAGIANVRGIEEGKTEVGFGNSISHSHRRTNRRWNPNIQTVRARVAPGTTKRLNVCTGCLKAGKVTR